MNTFLDGWSPRVLSVLRFFAGFMMLWHGSQKLFNVPFTERGAAGEAFMIFAGVLEFFGGILIMLGLFTRWAAFLLSGTMAVAYWTAHGTNGKGFLPLQNGGELAVLYCFVFLYFFFAGGGTWSLDNLISRNKNRI